MSIIRKLSNWYFSKNALPYWCILAIDTLCVYVAGISCYVQEFGATSLIQNFTKFNVGLFLCLCVYIICFRLYHTYRGVIRYSSFVDLLRLGRTMIVASLGVCALRFAQEYAHFDHLFIVPDYTSILLMLFLATMAMWLVRIIVKHLFDNFHMSPNKRSTFIYGCLHGGVAIAKHIRNHPDSQLSLEGFISTDEMLADAWLLGVKVYFDTDDVVKIMQKMKVTVLLVSPIQTEHFRKRESLVNALIKAGIKIMMMPNPEEWDGKSEIAHNQLREVEVEDLLPRDKIEVDMKAIGEMLTGKRILITGAAGSIGSEMARQVATFSPSELILVDQAETPMHDVRLYMAKHHNDLNVWTIVGNITNKEHMERIFADHRPEYVFHAAAYKHVPMMEDNPAMAVQNNVYGTRVIADLAVKYGTKKFVMISTDKAVNPTNVMGCSKRICEIYCQALNKAIEEGNCPIELLPADDEGLSSTGRCQFITTRFGNVLGSNGSVIPIFKDQIRRGGPLTVTHPDIIRFFMLIPEACRLVLEAGTMGHGGEIFVFDMGKPVRIADLAQRMIDLSGAKGVHIEYTGLRDGEKLYEEVLNDAEQTMPTHHPKIKVAAVREYPYELALKNEKELHELSFGFDNMAIVRKMKDIVPEYKSRHSVYESLDK